MDAKLIAKIREWVKTERELYARFVEEKNEEALDLCRRRVFFLAMSNITAVLDEAESMLRLSCGHPAACLKHYTPKGKEVCLRCKWDNKKKQRGH